MTQMYVTMTSIAALLAVAAAANIRTNSIDQVSPSERQTGRGSIRGRDWVQLTMAPVSAISVTLGQRMELECEAIGSPAPSIRWLRGAAPITQVDDEDFETNSIIGSDGVPQGGLAKVKSRMVIDCALPQDEGVYSCAATAGDKTVRAAGTVVLVRGGGAHNLTALLTACPGSRASGARITDWSPVYMENIGSDVTLPCRAQGYPRPAVYWLDADSQLIAGNGEPRYKVLSNGDLAIAKLRWSDMGSYICVASNTGSRDTVSSFIYPVLSGDR